MAAPMAHAVPSQWSSGLCDCFSGSGEDCLCCCALCCPCIVYGKLNNQLSPSEVKFGGDQTMSCLMYCCFDFAPAFVGLPGLSCIAHMWTRTAIRNRYGLPAEPCHDFCVACWCNCCSLIQESKELKYRGAGQGGGAPMHKNNMY